MVRAGYKETEVGVIPIEWGEKKLEDVLEFKYGTSQKEIIDDNGEYPIFATGGLVGTGRDYIYDKPSVIIGRKGTIDVPQFIEVPFWAIDTTYYTKIYEGTNPKFVYYLFILLDWYSYNEASGVPSLNASTLRKIKVLFPPTLEEQDAIVEVLSDMDALIAALDKLIAKKRAIKTAAMQQLLTGKIRLPGFSGEWGEKKLEDVLEFKYGKSQKEIIDDNGEYPIFATGGLVGTGREYIYDKPSVIIGRKGTIDVPQFIEVPFWAIDTTYYTKICEDTNPKFVYYLFILLDWYSYNEASGVPSLNAPTLRIIKVPFPPTLDEQDAIVEVFSDMDVEIAALETRRDKTYSIKQGMMQELLTGKTRLLD